MITTETDTSEFAIPLRIELKKQDSVLMKKIEITQIKGEKTYNTKLQKNIGGFKIETTQGNVEYRIKIFLKSIKKPIKISGSIAYWVLCEDAATPPSEQAFTLYF
ncbi:MAG: hypothetical protein JNL70_26685 [Saprospiraceae bacterium]|nr:hypothetical protein [Saprospiraceae bacterium]